MLSKNQTPSELAKEIARIIETDPIVASQIKQYIQPTRLVERLEIVKPDDLPSVLLWVRRCNDWRNQI